jgi:acyl-CoA oxidase
MQMLIEVLPNGDYVAPQHSKLSYGTMVFVRSIMIRDQSMQLGCAATIAVRYSAIRRQGEIHAKYGYSISNRTRGGG